MLLFLAVRLFGCFGFVVNKPQIGGNVRFFFQKNKISFLREPPSGGNYSGNGVMWGLNVKPSAAKTNHIGSKISPIGTCETTPRNACPNVSRKESGTRAKESRLKKKKYRSRVFNRDIV